MAAQQYYYMKRKMAVNMKDYETEAFHMQLDRIKHRLVESTKDTTITTKTLATIVGQFIQFQEDFLGRDQNIIPKRLPKLPAKLFRDFSENGPLYTILYNILEFKKLHGLRKLDFTVAASKADLYYGLLESIRNQLITNNQLRIPRLFFTNQFAAEERTHLIRVASHYGAAIVQIPEQATHLIYKDFKPASNEDKMVEYIRTIDKKGHQCQVHFWYYPDSYDTWMPVHEVEGEPQDPEQLADPPQWSVTQMWLLDMIPFNEWMNESDYEPAWAMELQPAPAGVLVPNTDLMILQHILAPAVVPAAKIVWQTPAPAPAVVAAAPAPKGRGRPKADPDAMAVDDDAADAAPAGRGRGRKRAHSEIGDGDYDDEDVKRAKAAAASTRNIKVSTTPRNTIPGMLAPKGPALATKQGAARKAELSRQPNPLVANLSSSYAVVVASTPAAINPNEPALVLPAHAEWFDMNKIHDYERQAVPEFFNTENTNGSKTPEVYKEYRDFMIHAYQQAPSHYLTFTACRRSLSGDALAVKHVHDFLEQVGLINYAVAPETCAVYVAPNSPGAHAPATQHLLRADSVPTLRTAPYSVLHTQPGTVMADVNLVLNKFVSGATEDAKTTKYFCSKCHEVCKDMRYDSQKHATGTYTLCKNCFALGGYPHEMNSADFNRVDMMETSQLRDDSVKWSAEETLKLLEGIEQFGQEWDRVAAHVGGNKTADQCLSCFLRMPIGDPYTQHQVLSSHQAGKTEKHIESPLSSVQNPLMSMLVFLREAVSPATAAAAAQGALKSLMSTEFPRQQQLLEQQQRDAMDVDEVKDEGAQDVEFLKNIQASASAALAAATLKAALMAEREDREIQRLVHKVVEAQIKKVELKTKYFDELDRVLKDEHQKIEHARARLTADRLTFEEQRKAAQQSAEAK